MTLVGQMVNMDLRKWSAYLLDFKLGPCKYLRPKSIIIIIWNFYQQEKKLVLELPLETCLVWK